MGTRNFEKEISLEIASKILAIGGVILGITLFITIGLVAPKYSFESYSFNWLGVAISIGTLVFFYCISSLLEVVAEISRSLKK